MKYGNITNDIHVQNQLTNYHFLYQKAEGDNMNVSHNVNLILVLIISTKKWQGLFHSGPIIGTFAAHLTATQGARRVPELEVESKRPAYDHSYATLALSAAGVSQFSCFIICWKSKIIFTGSACSPPLCNWHGHSSNGLHNWKLQVCATGGGKIH